MSPSPGARILLIEPGPEDAVAALPTAAALGRLADQAEVERAPEPVGDPSEWLRRLVADRSPDLVVLDLGVGTLADAVLDGLRSTGPPVLVVSAESHEEVALAAFRRGAAECVAAGPEYADLLPVVALEQIRRWREARERGAALSRIRWLEQLHEAIVQEIPAALAVVDAEGRLLAVNPEFCQVWDVAREEVLGRSYAEVLPDELVLGGELDALLDAAAEGRPVEPRLCRTGTGALRRSYDARARRLDDERLLLVLSDVSASERLSREVDELRRYNDDIIQNMNSALLVVDRQGRITAANPMAARILDPGPGGLKGRSIWEWFPSQSRERNGLWRSLASGERLRGAETTITRADGIRVPIGVSSAPLDRDGERLGAVAIFQDLTEIKQLQRQVLQTEKMASIGQLAAGIAHEINNPMGFIHANLFQMSEYLGDFEGVWERVQTLRKAVQSGDPAEIGRAGAALGDAIEEVDAEFLLSDCAKAVRESLEGSERIRHIVQDLRAFSHRDTDEPVESDLNQCLDSTANIVWTMMKHSVVLTKDYRDLPPVRCYPMQLQQVFMNLLVNAYQAIEEAGRSRGEIRLRTRGREDGVSIAVEDTGCGIRSADQARIFDPFFTTKEVGVGTGLGLSTSYNLVSRHGGTIRVRSEPGSGSTFEVILPLDGSGGEPGS